MSNDQRVFVCSKLRATDTVTFEQHVADAQSYGRYVVREKLGSPFIPHLMYPQFLDDAIQEEREAGMKAGVAFLDICDAFYVFLDETGQVSSGMQAELTHARHIGLPLRVFQKMPDGIQERSTECLTITNV